MPDMANADDWCRNPRWDATEESAFLAKLAKTRSVADKARFARLKAEALAATGDLALVRAAVGLLYRALHESPGDAELAVCYGLLGRCQAQLGNVDAALVAYRAALLAEGDGKDSPPDAWTGFSALVVSRKVREHYGDVVALLKRREASIVLPAHRFIAAACRSLIAWENGAKGDARTEADRALAVAERPHENTEIVDGFGEFVGRLRKIAR